MPKCTLIGNTELDTDLAKFGEYFKGLILIYEMKRHVSRLQTIQSSEMSQGAFYKCWKDPSLFRAGQLIKIFDFLRIPENERRFG